jgi:D-alanyl-D-alanine-carboxypeptidase/D-alanyl-D-alanine-endopeptidase
MTNTGSAFGRTNNIAAGHQVDGGYAPYWEFGALAGAGFLKSSLNDLMSFVRANIRPEDSPMGDVLEACQQKRGEAWTGNVGYGWQLTRTLQGQLDFVWHNGGTGGFVSFVGFDRNNGNGVVMLSSSGDAMKGDFYLDTLAMEILKLASKISLD